MEYEIRYRRGTRYFATREAAEAEQTAISRRIAERRLRRRQTADVEERKCRATGATIRIHDTWSPLTEFDPEVDADGKRANRWLTICQTHATVCSHAKLALARAHAAWPEWCGECQAILDPRCRFVRAGERCERTARKGWTMCASHYSAGRTKVAARG